MAATPRLAILQSIWGLDGLRGGEDWPMAERMRRIAGAGFDGISTHFFDRHAIGRWISAAKDYGFVIEGQAFPNSIAALRPAVELAAEHDIAHLCVQGDVRTESVAAAAEIAAGWQALGRECGVTVLIETHRNTLTTDLWATVALLEAVPGLELVADLSHYVVGQEITLPPSGRNAAQIARILASARALHGRVASSGQVQVEAGLAHHQRWVALFHNWWRLAFCNWIATAQSETVLTFTCELGPQPYATAGLDGRDLTCRWQDAQKMRTAVLDLWKEVASQGPA